MTGADMFTEADFLNELETFIGDDAPSRINDFIISLKMGTRYVDNLIGNDIIVDIANETIQRMTKNMNPIDVKLKNKIRQYAFQIIEERISQESKNRRMLDTHRSDFGIMYVDPTNKYHRRSRSKTPTGNKTRKTNNRSQSEGTRMVKPLQNRVRFNIQVSGLNTERPVNIKISPCQRDHKNDQHKRETCSKMQNKTRPHNQGKSDNVGREHYRGNYNVKQNVSVSNANETSKNPDIRLSAQHMSLLHNAMDPTVQHNPMLNNMQPIIQVGTQHLMYPMMHPMMYPTMYSTMYPMIYPTMYLTMHPMMHYLSIQNRIYQDMLFMHTIQQMHMLGMMYSYDDSYMLFNDDAEFDKVSPGNFFERERDNDESYPNAMGAN